MNNERFDSMMRTFETAHDHGVLPGIHMIARIDGRSFTRLTKEVHDFEAPFDERFRDHMIATTEHLMRCGFQVIYGYTQSDEISLLFHRESNAFGRSLRKYISILAGEASAKFSLLLGDVGAFDCLIAQLTSVARVRLLPLARRERRAQCAQRTLLLGAAARGKDGGRGDRRARWLDRRREERAPLRSWDQLQRSPLLAEARRRAALGRARDCRRTDEEPHPRRDGAADAGELRRLHRADHHELSGGRDDR